MNTPLWKRVVAATGRSLSILVLTTTLAAVTGLAVGRFCFDLRYEPILTGSMAPNLATGTLIALEKLDPRDVATGETIAFQPPKPYGEPGGAPVIHRVYSLTKSPDGTTVMTTKGDANPAPDPWKIDLESGTYRAPVFQVPYAGGVITWIRSLGPFGTAALITGLLITWLSVRALRRSGEPVGSDPHRGAAA
ncbi:MULTISPECIES: signal peptidase I [unclassified Streptomyces]|uniref:Signal peptidase I n=1 Tax=Streptomyces sp. NBC_00060 TaxID=2975636 RepID=A0AAU2GSU8_9ACTN